MHGWFWVKYSFFSLRFFPLSRIVLTISIEFPEMNNADLIKHEEIAYTVPIKRSSVREDPIIFIFVLSDLSSTNASFHNSHATFLGVRVNAVGPGHYASQQINVLLFLQSTFNLVVYFPSQPELIFSVGWMNCYFASLVVFFITANI